MRDGASAWRRRSWLVAVGEDTGTTGADVATDAGFATSWAGTAEERVVAWALSAAPGPEAVTALATVDPDRLDGARRVDLLKAWERAAAWLAAQQQRAAAAVVAATEEAGLTGDLARHEVGVALRLSPGTAYERVRRAVELTGRLARTGEALAAGTISLGQATALADAVEGLADEVALAVQARVLPRAAEWTVAETRRAVRRAVVAVDPTGAQRRAEVARAGRRVERWADDDGMAELRAVLTAEQAGLVWAELTTRARAEDARLRAAGSTAHQHAAIGSGAACSGSCAGSGAACSGSCAGSGAACAGSGAACAGSGAACAGSCAGSGAACAGSCAACAGSCAGSPGMDALRADALVAAVLAPGGRGASPGESRAVSDDAPGGSTAARVQVQVTVDLATLLGLAERPGELRGHGPVTPAVARALAADAEWVRWVTDPLTGQLLDLGRRRYRPSRPLERFLQAAHQVCGWPGCHHPADRCDADHVVPFASGGETTRANLGPLCRQHHNAKTHGKWRLARAPDGTGHWTSPLGASYSAPPTRHPPDG